MSTHKYYQDMLPGLSYNVKDKCRNIAIYTRYMLNRTRRIFEYENLPETIPEKYLEMYLQCNGFACIAKYKDNLYAFFGGLGGVPDEYYFPTICTVANPALKLSEEYKIGTDCIIIQNDTTMTGLIPMYQRYASALVENDITFNKASTNARAAFLITAPDDRTREAANKFLRDLENGESAAVADNTFLDGIKTQPMMQAGAHILTDLIEYQQYLKAGWFNEIGLNANYNMKREALSDNESEMNHDALIPLVDDMLQCRKAGLEKVNAMFGTNISVKLSGVWETNAETITNPEPDETTLEETEPETPDEPKEGEPDETE